MMRRMVSFMIMMMILTVSLVTAADKCDTGDTGKIELDVERASKFAAMALRCIHQEYPNKLSHVMNDEKEVLSPKTLHPAFYGCFDWHSSVHGHWMLIRLLKTFPKLPEAPAIRQALHQNLTAANIEAETAYLDQKSRKAFERTYGWAWLLKLAEELHGWDDTDGKQWAANLEPLEKAVVKRYLDFFPLQNYAIRTGVHPNTAFGIAFALDYARKVNHKELEERMVERSYFYFGKDTNCPADWEPGGEDFFSPCLMEAWLMMRVMKPAEFVEWFHRFLPQFKARKPLNLLEPALVGDRTDGKLVHLDGVNLSRAWCMKQIARRLPANDGARTVLLKACDVLTQDALAHIHSGDYAGEHWLASFAVYLLTD